MTTVTVNATVSRDTSVTSEAWVKGSVHMAVLRIDDLHLFFGNTDDAGDDIAQMDRLIEALASLRAQAVVVFGFVSSDTEAVA